MATHSSTPTETVVKEFTPIGKYRVRLVSPITSGPRSVFLDVREYINGETFQGFTRKGIRLDSAGMELLGLILNQVRDLATAPTVDQVRGDRQALVVGKKPGDMPKMVKPKKAAVPSTMPPQSFTLFDLVDATEQRRANVEQLAPAAAPDIDDSQETDIPPQYRHAPTDKEEADDARKRTPAPGKKMTLSQMAALL